MGVTACPVPAPHARPAADQLFHLLDSPQVSETIKEGKTLYKVVTPAPPADKKSPDALASTAGDRRAAAGLR